MRRLVFVLLLVGCGGDVAPEQFLADVAEPAPDVAWDLEPAQSEPDIATPGPAVALSFEASPAELIAGVAPAVAFEVRVSDALGNAVAAPHKVTIWLDANPAEDHLLGTLKTNSLAGLATFADLRLRHAASGVTLRAESPGLAPATSALFDVLPGPALSVSFDGPPPSAIAGELLAPVSVTARDAYGNRVFAFEQPVALTTGLPGLGASLQGTAVTDAVMGVATFEDLWLGQARRGYSLKALSQGLEPAVSAPFHVEPGLPAALVLSKPPPFACVDLPLSPMLTVGVEDAFGNLSPTPVDVTLSVVNPSGFPLFGSTKTQSSVGLARFPEVGPAALADAIRLRAQAEGLEPAESDPISVFECVTIQGTATYDAVPNTVDGLDYGGTQVRPIRGATVQIVDAETGKNTLAEGATDAEGGWILGVPEGPDTVRARVVSVSAYPSIRVQDNTGSNAVYTVDGPDLALKFGPLVTAIHAGSGWLGDGYGTDRQAGPFAILDTARRAADTLFAARPTLLPQVTFNWSVDNRPEPGDVKTGRIGSTHFNPVENAIYLMGKADAQTDEYDRHTIVHEWTHWLEHNLGRSDSVGGTHWLGARIEPRLAFGEGVADAFPAIVLFPETVYAMTFGPQQGQGSGFDVDANAGTHDPHPGWFSEGTVAAIIFDLWDGAQASPEPWDTVELGLTGILDVLLGAQVETNAATTIFSFMAGVRTAHPQLTDALDALLAQHNMAPIIDEWGTGATNDAEWSELLPVYPTLTADGAILELPLLGKPAVQFVYATRFARFEGTGSLLTLRAESFVDVDLVVLRRGRQLAHTMDTALNTVTLQTEKGAWYVVVVRGEQNGQQTNACALTLEPTQQAHAAPVRVLGTITPCDAVIRLVPEAFARLESLQIYGIDGLLVVSGIEPAKGHIYRVRLDSPDTESNLVVVVHTRTRGVSAVGIASFTVAAVTGESCHRM